MKHLIIGVAGLELSQATRQLLREVRPGGVILFARNVQDAGQLKALIRHLREYTSLVAIDQENNRVNRLREIVGELPGLSEVIQTGTARQLGETIGRSLHDLGIGLDFAPVLDLDLHAGQVDNALRDRCWGQTPAEVIAGARPFVAGLRAAGVKACAKHFPGLGAARQDSHEVLPVIERSRAELLAEDVEPFRQLGGELPAIMVGHAVYPALDERPASLSRRIVTGLLREELGYRGVVISDDMEMGAIGDLPAAVGEAVAAGVDLVLVCHTPEKIMAAFESLQRVKMTAESVKRVERFTAAPSP